MAHAHYAGISRPSELRARLTVRIAWLTVRMVRLAVRLAGACGVRRVARPRAKVAKYLFRTHYQRLSESYFALFCTLLHSFALFVHRFVEFRTFAT